MNRKSGRTGDKSEHEGTGHPEMRHMGVGPRGARELAEEAGPHEAAHPLRSRAQAGSFATAGVNQSNPFAKDQPPPSTERPIHEAAPRTSIPAPAPRPDQALEPLSKPVALARTEPLALKRSADEEAEPLEPARKPPRRKGIVPRPPSLPLIDFAPNLLTLTGLCAGLTAIRFALAGRFDLAAALIVLAALIDGMDGLLARRLNAQSHFGAELDSLSDFVCFGVAPALILYRFAFADLPGPGWLAVLVFVLCCCLRLARFNVSRALPPPPGRAFFVGVPAPAGAMLGLLPLFSALAFGWTLTAWDWPIVLWLIFVGLLMISRLPTPSPKGLRIRREHAPLLFPGVAIVVGVLLMRTWAVPILACLLYLGVIAHAAWRHRRQLLRISARPAARDEA